LWGEIPESLGALTALEKLHLNHNKLSGEIPPALARASHLHQLELQALYDLFFFRGKKAKLACGFWPDSSDACAHAPHLHLLELQPRSAGLLLFVTCPEIGADMSLNRR
jgi:hypothetical protein